MVIYILLFGKKNVESLLFFIFITQPPVKIIVVTLSFFIIIRKIPFIFFIISFFKLSLIKGCPTALA